MEAKLEVFFSNDKTLERFIFYSEQSAFNKQLDAMKLSPIEDGVHKLGQAQLTITKTSSMDGGIFLKIRLSISPSTENDGHLHFWILLLLCRNHEHCGGPDGLLNNISTRRL